MAGPETDRVWSKSIMTSLYGVGLEGVARLCRHVNVYLCVGVCRGGGGGGGINRLSFVTVLGDI